MPLLEAFLGCVSQCQPGCVRWRQITGLARVTASSYGYNRQDEQGFHAAGYEEACSLLGITT